MQDLPHDMYALFALACALGVKHGLDPDHLATINGLIRFNSPTKPWLAKWSGVLFSLGHGLVVTIVIGMVAAMPEHMAIPGWLQQVGAVFSILILLLLGVLNLYAAGNSHQAITRPVSLKRWMCFKSGHPAVILGIGALFALSFDTMSHAVFFSIAASHLSIELYAFTLGIVFTCGMMVSDGVNGIITARFLQHSAERARIASRVMSFAIGSMSLMIAFIGISRLTMPTVSEKIEYWGMWAGILVFLWVFTGFAVSVLMGRISKVTGRSG